MVQLLPVKNVRLTLTYTKWSCVQHVKSITKAFNIQLAYFVCPKKTKGCTRKNKIWKRFTRYA